jgi:hypothetical protein
MQPAVEPVDPFAGFGLDEEIPEGEKPQDSEPTKPEDVPSAKPTEAEEEVKKFIRWLRKGHPTRAFEFKALDETYADVLNKFIETKDVDSARWYAEHYLGI